MFHRYLVLFLLIPGSLLVPRSLLAQKSAKKSDVKIILPKAGTMFVNTYFVTDSSGALVPKSVADAGVEDDTLFIAQSGVKRFGRTNCIVRVAKSHPDTTIISYAPNGDLYMRAVGTDSVWNKLPLGMTPGKKTTQSLPNDSGTMFGHAFNMPHRRTVEVLGHDTASVGTTVYDCIKLQIVDIRQYQDRDWFQGTLFWFSPELGYFVRQNAGWNGKYFLNQQLKVWR